jgi:transcriptional regulator with XRE-family HTH domain
MHPLLSLTPHLSYNMDKSNQELGKENSKNCAPFCAPYIKTMHNLGSQIKNIREFKNLTQKYVANRIGISQSKFARIENGAISITDELLTLISKVLETNSSSIKQFDKKVYQNLSVKNEYTPDLRQIAEFFKQLKDLHNEEIILLQKKIKLLEIMQY